MMKIFAILFLLPVMGFGQQKLLRAKPIHERRLSLGDQIKMDSVFYIGLTHSGQKKYIGLIVTNATDEELLKISKQKGYYKKGEEIFIVE
jgi:hypothetical protein